MAPYLAALGLILGGLSPLLVVMLSRNARKLNEIHVLVNSRLSDALHELKVARDELLRLQIVESVRIDKEAAEKLRLADLAQEVKAISVKPPETQA